MFIKYLLLFFNTGLYLLFYYPKLIYYSLRKDHISKEKRYNFVMKLVKKVSKGFKANITIEGLENIPSGNNIVFVPNHQSILDPCFLPYIDKTCFAISKKECEHYPYFKHIERCIDALYLDREDIRQAFRTLKVATNQMKENDDNMLIFLEGKVTLNEDKKMNEFKPGGLKPAYKNQSSIVPIAINGFYNCVHAKYNKNGYDCKVRILKPLYYEDYKDIKTVDLAIALHDEIEKNVIELRKEG